MGLRHAHGDPFAILPVRELLQRPADREVAPLRVDGLIAVPDLHHYSAMAGHSSEHHATIRHLLKLARHLLRETTARTLPHLVEIVELDEAKLVIQPVQRQRLPREAVDVDAASQVGGWAQQRNGVVEFADDLRPRQVARDVHHETRIVAGPKPFGHHRNSRRLDKARAEGDVNAHPRVVFAKPDGPEIPDHVGHQVGPGTHRAVPLPQAKRSNGPDTALIINYDISHVHIITLVRKERSFNMKSERVRPISISVENVR